MSSAFLDGGPNRIYTTTVTFDQLRLFAQEYMRRHVDPTDFKQAQPHLLYLLDALDHSVRLGPANEFGEWFDFPWLYEETSLRFRWRNELWPGDHWNTWRGYSDSCPVGFKWKSCSGSTLTAQKIAGSGAREYAIVCIPSDRQRSCGYMEIFQQQGIEMIETKTETGSLEQDEEPDWGSNPHALSRPPSGC